MSNRLTITRTTTALATSALLVLGLAACGGSGDDTSTDSETTTSAEETTSAEDETAEPEETTDEETVEASGDFCDAYSTLTEAQGALSDAASDPAQAVTALDELATSLEAAEAPAEISGDWDAVSGYFRQVADMTKAAVEDPANADPSALMDMMGDESFMTSAQNVSLYASQNC